MLGVEGGRAGVEGSWMGLMAVGWRDVGGW